jgi:hypothetical protein
LYPVVPSVKSERKKMKKTAKNKKASTMGGQFDDGINYFTIVIPILK